MIVNNTYFFFLTNMQRKKTSMIKHYKRRFLHIGIEARQTLFPFSMLMTTVIGISLNLNWRIVLLLYNIPISYPTFCMYNDLIEKKQIFLILTIQFIYVCAYTSSHINTYILYVLCEIFLINYTMKSQ